MDSGWRLSLGSLAILLACAPGCGRKLVFDSAGLVTDGAGDPTGGESESTSAGPSTDSSPGDGGPTSSSDGWSTGWDPSGGGWSSGWDPSGGGWSTGWDPSGGGWSSGWDPSGGGWSTGWDPSGGGWSSGWDSWGDTTGGADPCNNGIQDGDETDVDCGGSCGATCDNGQGCGDGGDCWGGQCSGGVCGCDAWIAHYGTPAQDNGVDVAAAGAGRIVTVGHTQGTLPGESSAGNFDLYATRYDSAGSLLWVRQLGTTASEFAEAVALTSDGSIYLAGTTGGAFPGHSNAGGTDAVVVKLDPAGNFLWAWQTGGPLSDDATDVTATPDGGVLVAGNLDHEFATQTSPSEGGVFLARLSADGDLLWLRELDSPERDDARGVALGPGGVVALVGATFGTLGLEGAFGGWDIFLAAYDLGGTSDTPPLWVHQYGTYEPDEADDVKIDPLGEIFVTGYTRGAFMGNQIVGGADLLVLKLDPGGEPLWSRTIGNSNNDYGRGLDLHPQGGVIVAGWTRAALDGQPAFGDWDVLSVRYDTAGTHMWTQIHGSSVADRGSGVAVDPAGNLYVAAETVGPLGGPELGNLDAALLRICEPLP